MTVLANGPVELADAPAVSSASDYLRPVWLRVAWISLALALLPIGLNAGLPFRLSLADVFLPLMLPVVLMARPLPRQSRLLGILVAWSVVVVLGWALLTATSETAPLGSMVFFWKSWIALLLAYLVIMRSRSPRAAVHRVLGLVAWSQIVLISLAYAGWLVTGRLIASATSDTGILVTGFSAGSWEYPIQLYGFGQVNVTAALLALAGPVLTYRATRARHLFAKVFWLPWIPASWWLILNSGSRGALVTAGVFVALLPLAHRKGLGRISVVNLAIALLIGVGVVANSQLILDASPKYARTLNEVGRGDAVAVSSGRDEINLLTLQDLERSPIFGTGFGDYYRFHTAADTRWVSSSPHNTYLGPFHKGGIPIGVGYLALMATCLPFRRVHTFQGTDYLILPLTVPILIGIFPVGDALTTPVLAANILTIAGAIIAARALEPDDGPHDTAPAASR